jgi:LmbE family N-acetylglucosaminyl deacetylase
VFLFFVVLAFGNIQFNKKSKSSYMLNKDSEKKISLEECAELNRVSYLGNSSYADKKNIFMLNRTQVKRVFLLDSDDRYFKPFSKFFSGEIRNVKHFEISKICFASDDLVVVAEKDFFSKNLSLTGDPLVLIYEDNYHRSNYYLPLTESFLEKKISALKNFHLSQVERTPFDTIVANMAEFALEKSNLKTQIPLEDYIIKDYSNAESSFSNFLHMDSLSLGENDQVVIVSPHPDDAEIGCGGLLQYLQQKKVKTTVWVVTSGYRSLIKKNALLKGNFYSQKLLDQIKSCGEIIESSQVKSQIRQEESFNAISNLNDKAKIEFINFPFYEASNYELSDKDKDLAVKLFGSLSFSARLFLFAPNPKDRHMAHQKTTELFSKTFANSSCLSKYIAYYNTPWTGMWNIYHYNDEIGFSFSAQVGRELLLSHGKEALDLKSLGGKLAQRYFVVRFSSIKKS